MTAQNGSRKAHFPAIEKKYGQPMSYWFNQMEQVADQKYPDQIAFLRENHGFSQTHANALVMYSRGSTTSKRFTTIDQFLKPLDETKQKTVLAIIKAIKTKYPKMEVVIAWNTPMLKLNNEYVFGVSVLKNHLLIAPWGNGVIEKFADRLTDYKVNKKTIQVPIDWKIDKKLLQDLVAARVAEL